MDKILNSTLWLSKPRFCLGVMTGTSLDSIDLSLNKITFSNTRTHIDSIYNAEYEFPLNYKEKILEIIDGKTSLKDISQMNFYFSRILAEAIIDFGKKNNIQQLDVVGLHGQTVWHEPEPDIFLNKHVTSTLQLGNGSVLAKLTGLPVVNDFRSADVALGGQGAPLMPIFDINFLHEKDHNNISLNIGGISNITFIPKSGRPDDVIGFDTGPGNVLIDLICKKHFNKDYDENGELARSGRINDEFLDKLMSIEFIQRDYPKSTGRELFNEGIIDKIDKIDKIDLLATFTAFTAKSISENLKKLDEFEKIIVSGGGAKNSYLIELIENYTGKKVINSKAIGIDPDFKEAMCFSYLAWRTLASFRGNLKNISGALKNVVTGSISF